MLGEHIPQEAGVTLERSSWLLPSLARHSAHIAIMSMPCIVFRPWAGPPGVVEKDVNGNSFGSARG